MQNRTDVARPPGPRGGLPYFGQALNAGRDPLGFFTRAAMEYGDIVQFDFGPVAYVMVNAPDAIKHVLIDNPRNYVKGLGYKLIRYVVGDGLITSEGDFWRRQRRLAQPAFHRERLAEFASRMVDAADDMLKRWSAHPSRAALDVHEELMRVTLDIVGRTLLGESLDSRVGIGDAMAVTVRGVTKAASPFAPPFWLPTPGNLRFKQAKRTLDALVMDVIARRRQAGSRVDRRDLLGMLMSARDEDTHAEMTDQQLRDEVMTIVTAGHETTANAMTWTLYLLSKHPGVARRVEAEVAAVLGDRRPTVDDLPRLPYGHAVIQESLRLYPPVWVLERNALGDDVIGGYPVRKGTQVTIIPYVLHRHPAYWENPEGFDPERFLSGQERPRYTYLPFGTGPRVCIGNAFALMEAQILLSCIVQQYRLELVPGARIEPEPVVSLRPRHGMPMKLIPQKTLHPSGWT